MGAVADIISEGVLDGAQSLLDTYMSIAERDHLLVAYTPESRRYAAIISAVCEARGITNDCLPMHPIRDETIAARLRRWADGVSPIAPDGTIHILTLERDTMSHQVTFNALKTHWPRADVRLSRAISVCDAFFEMAMTVAPETLSRRNSHVLSFCWGRTDVRVKTDGGTDLEITFDSERYDWINNRGKAREGGTTILPAGEVATYPARIDGRLVADFAYNVNAINRLDSRLDDTPVTVEIEDGMAVDYSCDSGEVMRFLDDCFSRHFARHVGEVGFGTHPAVHDPIYMNSHINERSPGIHIGFGQHNQLGPDPGYQAQIHFDLIARGAKLSAKGKELDLLDLRDAEPVGEFTTRDEDVFSPEFEDLDVEDCCGLLKVDGLELFSDLLGCDAHSAS